MQKRWNDDSKDRKLAGGEFTPGRKGTEILKRKRRD